MKKKIIFVIALLLLVGVSASIIKAVILDNDVQVEKDTTLTYYLDVSYDGVDIKGIESSDTATADIKSGYIYVEDKIPEGLTFENFVTTVDGSIGAVKRSDGSSCSGYVVDGVDGLNYDANTRKVSFKVKNLQAGCKLTVGINTKTPASIDDPNTEVVETRRDFYNAATATEDNLTVVSNTVHAWMGDEAANLYDVEYTYEGDVPSNVPELPLIHKYAENTNVGVEKDAILEGYRFTGWTTDDISVTNGTFTMPNKKVTFKGSFEKINGYKVTYKIEGDTPNGYILPLEKEYYADGTVKVDSLKKGDVINGYKFLGWTTSDVTISEDNDFIMPNKNVTIIGKFEEIKYKVSYAFQGVDIPTNSSSLLPVTKSYKPGEIVKLESEPQVDGYRFLGWYKEDNFEMPESDIIIYGEWTIEKGQFEPTITKEIIDQKDNYQTGDIVKFKVVVTNTADYEIHDVYVSENNDNAKFITDDGYSVETDHIVKINSIPAKGSVTVYAEYEVTDKDEGIITAESELTGALANNNYTLNMDKEYKATVEFKVTKDKITSNKNDKPNNPNTGDNIKKFLSISIMSLILLLGCVLILTKYRNKKA